MVLCRSTTMQNFELLVWKMTELWLFEIFGIILCYVKVWHGMVYSVGIMQIYYHAKFRTASLKNHWVMTVWNIWYLVWFGILGYDIICHGMVCWNLLQQKISDTYFEKWLIYDSLKYLVWLGILWYGMVWPDIICRYYLLSCKILNS